MHEGYIWTIAAAVQQTELASLLEKRNHHVLNTCGTEMSSVPNYIYERGMCVFSGLNIHEDGSPYMQKASMNEFSGGRNDHRRITDAEDKNMS